MRVIEILEFAFKKDLGMFFTEVIKKPSWGTCTCQQSSLARHYIIKKMSLNIFRNWPCLLNPTGNFSWDSANLKFLYLWPITNSVAVSRQLYQKEGFMLQESSAVVSLQPSCNHLVSSSNWHDKNEFECACSIQITYRVDNILSIKSLRGNEANIPSHFLV